MPPSLWLRYLIVFVRYRTGTHSSFGAVVYDVFVSLQLVHRQWIVPNLWTGWETQGLGPQRPVAN